MATGNNPDPQFDRMVAAIAAAQSSTVHQSQKVPLPRYDGEDLTPFTVSRFLTQFEAYGNSAKLNGAAAWNSCFLDCLSGSAETWFRSFHSRYHTTHNEYPDHKDVLDAFKLCFEPLLADSQAIEILFAVSQKTNEPGLKYIFRASADLDAYADLMKRITSFHNLEDHCRRTFNLMFTQFAIHAILRGMKKNWLDEVHRVANGPIKDFDHLHTAARQATTNLGSHTTAASQVNKPTATAIVGEISTSSDAVDNEIGDHLAQIDFLRTRRAGPSTRGRGRGAARRPAHPMLACLRCGMLGHYADACPDPPTRAGVLRYSRAPPAPSARSLPQPQFAQRNPFRRAPIHAVDTLQDELADLTLQTADVAAELDQLHAVPPQVEDLYPVPVPDMPETQDLAPLDAIDYHVSGMPAPLPALDFQDFF